MPVINLGIDFAQAKLEGEKQIAPVPPGVYTLQCKGIEVGLKTQKGRPQMKWDFVIVNAADPNLNGKRMSVYVVDPSDGNLSGIGFLVDITSKLGKAWSGNQLNTDDYLGKTAQANVTVDEEGKWNRVGSWV